MRLQRSTRVARCLPLAALWVALSACAGGTPDAEEPGSGTAITRLDGSRWLWLESSCSDGPVDLAAEGLEQELSLRVIETRLLITQVTRLPGRACSNTEVWLASLDASGRFRFDPQASVTLPAGAECGEVAREPLSGSIRLSGDTLEVVTARSPWCRGFDARFVYRRAPAVTLDARALVTRYVAHFNRRDPEALAALFSDAGSLVEPFSATADGNYARHSGRDAIRAWYAAAFQGSSWLAMRLLDIDATDASGQVVASWEYMDDNLQAPIRGRNLFVLAGGEIFETEVQLETTPTPRRTPLAGHEVTGAGDG